MNDGQGNKGGFGIQQCEDGMSPQLMPGVLTKKMKWIHIYHINLYYQLLLLGDHDLNIFVL